ncbi:MAG: hypothetical protein RR382_00445 [Tannerellaceae bacterium]
MIRIRRADGKVMTLPKEANFIEIANDSGDLACVVYKDNTGVIHVINPGEDDFNRYTKLFPDVKISPIVNYNALPTSPNN